MNYFVESVFVGIYRVFIFTIISYFFENTYVSLFIVGFAKHFFGNFLNIHNFYCNYGYSCYLHNDCKNGKCLDNNKHLFLRSLFEGFLYLIVGSALIEMPFTLKNIYLYFLIGVMLHLGSEWLGIHKYFCKTYCYKKE